MGQKRIGPTIYVPWYVIAMIVMVYGAVVYPDIRFAWYAIPMLAWNACGGWMRDVKLERRMLR